MTMLQMLYVGLLVVFLSIANPIGEKDVSLISKFHQTDYKLKFEWGETVRYNKQYLRMFDLHLFKYNRTCTAANLTFHYLIKVGNELEIIVQAYKFTSSNDYRLFPMRFEVNLCKAVDGNVAGALSSLNCGNFTGCPLRKGRTYHICNWTPDEKKLPPFVPNGRYKLELQALYHSMEMWLLNVYIEVYRPFVPK